MWETGNSETQVPFLSSLIVQVVSSFGIILVENGKSVFWKAFVVLLSAFLCGLLPPVVFYRATMIYPSSVKEQFPGVSVFESFANSKGRTLMRLGFGSAAMFVSTVCLLFSLGSSTVANVTVFSLIKLFVEVASNSVRATKVGRVIFFAGIASAIWVIAVTSNMSVIAVFVSALMLWMSNLYMKLLVPSVHGEVFALCGVCCGAGLLSGVAAIYVERLNVDLCLVRTVLAGILAFSPLSYLVLMKKATATTGTGIAYCVVPPVVGLILNSVGRKSETPLSIFLGVVLAFIGCHLLGLQPTETIILKPFSTRRSTVHFGVSVVVMMGAVAQYVSGSRTGQIWRMADSLYLLICLRWSVSEVIRTIQKESTIQFSYGHGRLAHMFQFSLGIFAIFNSIFVSGNCFAALKGIQSGHMSSSWLSIFVHLLLLGFFVWFPRGQTRSRASIINAVNFSAANDTTQSASDKKYEPCDLVTLGLSLLGLAVKGFLLDRVIAMMYLAIIMYVSIPMIKESVAVLLQSTSDSMTESISQIKSELKMCHCVVAIQNFNVWQNDDDLSVATVRVQVDERVCTKPQDFLMYIISLCQQAGILDVTVEIINRDSLTVASHPGYFRNTPSPI